MGEIPEVTRTIIAAVDDERNLAIDGKLPWSRQLADKEFYLKMIADGTVVMGSTTYAGADHSREGLSMVVISRRSREELGLPEDVELISDVESIVGIKPRGGATRVFITGGGSVYNQAEELVADEIYLNVIHTDGPRDGTPTKFPIIDEEKWELVNTDEIPADENNEFPATFKFFVRR